MQTHTHTLTLTHTYTHRKWRLLQRPDWLEKKIQKKRKLTLPELGCGNQNPSGLLWKPELGRLHQLTLLRFAQLLLAPAWPFLPCAFLCLSHHHYWLSRGEIFLKVADSWVTQPALPPPLLLLYSSPSLWPDMEHEKMNLSLWIPANPCKKRKKERKREKGENKGPVYFLDSPISKELGEQWKCADCWAEQRKRCVRDCPRKMERKVV